DGAQFGRRETDNDEKVLIAVESRNRIDNKGKERPKAGFAKVYFAPEQKQDVANFIEQDIRIFSEIHTDAAKAFEYNDSQGVNLISRPMLGDKERLERWPPRVQKFVFNAKSWIRGTHHGVNSRYFKLYLAEYTYCFNRRHDVSRFGAIRTIMAQKITAHPFHIL
ncbi:MAG: transposase, partial [Bacteriovoracales bacterium]|nr:transposase [Bacteriovoracales bacterium]